MRYTLPAIMLAAACALPAPAAAEVLTFDDLGTNSFTPIPTSYHGYVWDFWAAVNGANYGPSGYANGVVSGGNSACACASDFSQPFQSISRAGLFTFNGGFFTSAWNDGATLVIEGRLGGTTLFSNSSIVNTAGPNQLAFNWSGIDNLRFSISGGTPSGLPGAGNYFAVDNLSLTAGVPEPMTWALMILGFGLVGGAMRRRNGVTSTRVTYA
jgi:hypothetical protein